MNEFDEKAATWDDDPVRVERAEAIAKRMRELLDLRAYRSAIEYGSGTGLLSFALKDNLEKVTLVDGSEEMTRVARDKIYNLGVSNLFPIRADLLEEKEFLPLEKFDLVYMLLTLHHVDDIDRLFGKFKQKISHLGDLVIIDLEKEDGSFHDGDFFGHKGFDRYELEKKLREAGLDPYHYEVCYEIEKGEGADKKTYPVFMMLARA